METTTNKLTLYIAGPMRGYKNNNFQAFHAAAKWWSMNCAVEKIFNPAQMDEEAGYDGDCAAINSREYLKSCMQRDIAAIMASDALYMLTGWEKSEGARVEHALAVYLGLKIFYES